MVRHAAIVFSQWFLMNWSSTVYGLVLAVVGAIMIELFGITRGIWAFQGYVRNKFATRSAANLRKRIVELEKYRAALESDQTSELSLVLALFKFVLGMLTMMCVVAATVLLNRILPPWHPLPEPLGLSIILIGILLAAVLGIFGMKTADLNTPSKIAATITPVDAQISRLKARLLSRVVV